MQLKLTLHTDVADSTDTSDTAPAGDTGNTDTDNPDSDNPDSDNPDSDNPDSDAPDSDNPDSDAPDSDAPDSDAPADKCEKLSVNNDTYILTMSNLTSYVATVTGNAAGDKSLPDIFRLALSTYPVKSKFDLSTSLDQSQYIFLLLEDLVEQPDGSGQATKIYLQQSGELEFTEVFEGSFESKGHASVILAEINTSTFEPVEGGKCYEVENFSWDTVCVPQCEEGWQCGSDGCGGTCGNGCDGQACGENHMCVDYNCETITLNTDSVTYTAKNKIYSATYTPNTGDAETDDIFRMQLFQVDPLTDEQPYDLEGTNYADDAGIFILVWEDNSAKAYFQQKGTVNITDYDATTGNITAAFSGIRVEQVTIENGTYKSTPVAGGKCYDIADTTFTYTASDTPEDDFTCVEIYSCFNACGTDSNCMADCYNQGSEDAQATFMELFQCQYSCQQTSDCDVETECATEIDNCGLNGTAADSDYNAPYGSLELSLEIDAIASLEDQQNSSSTVGTIWYEFAQGTYGNGEEPVFPEGSYPITQVSYSQETSDTGAVISESVTIEQTTLVPVEGGSFDFVNPAIMMNIPGDATIGEVSTSVWDENAAVIYIFDIDWSEGTIACLHAMGEGSINITNIGDIANNGALAFTGSVDLYSPKNYSNGKDMSSMLPFTVCDPVE